MSQENVEIVRALLEAVNRRDWDAAFDHMTRDFEYDNSRAIGPNRGVYNRAQTRQFLDQFAAVWQTVRYEADGFIEAGQHLVVPFTTSVRGRDGIELQAHPTFVCTIREGAIARLCMYQERREALEAAGLRNSDIASKDKRGDSARSRCQAKAEVILAGPST